ncbi:hypothetical protein PMI14_05824 [Acidovorax sp. CF316]|uniref:hypothetical protein n=1 Tax=Acidovorax sp. CF316 TaxID=1144317 RepID=UPI00026BC7F0|nr:hypothetical protein [Acidovorax sp. CF316]EJE49581.1 hypothetical protein PMI14_05824 [Acidovorax sp. CF316]
MKVERRFQAVPKGGIYPVWFDVGDECPPELEATAKYYAEHGEGQDQLRQDGPSIAQWLASCEAPENYPPPGYASQSTAEEIAAAIEARNRPPHDGPRDDGPTVAEYVAAGYLAVNYPPSGYLSRSTDEEIAAAIAAQGDGPADADANGDGKTTVAELREALTARGISFGPRATKAELLALLPKG